MRFFIWILFGCSCLQATPFQIAERIDDMDFDQRIREIFCSHKFVNEPFYYYLDGEYYKVRLIYNPDKLTLQSLIKKTFQFNDDTIIKGYKVTWDLKYGILVNPAAPQELIDHIVELANASYWDWYFNFTIQNGTRFELTKSYETIDPTFGGYEITTYTTTYPLDTWFDCTKDLSTD